MPAARARPWVPNSITFFPRDLRACDVRVEVRTAGSIPLVIQAWLSVALAAGGRLHITGGTEVSKSPTIDYLEHVLAGVLRSSGADIRIDILKRGYFPEGGGEVAIHVKRKLSPIHPAESGGPAGIVSASSNLPDHVAERQASAAAEYILASKREVGDVIIDRRSRLSTGTSCTVWRGAEKGRSGKRGVSAEKDRWRRGLCCYRGIRKQPGDVDLYLSDHSSCLSHFSAARPRHPRSPLTQKRPLASWKIRLRSPGPGWSGRGVLHMKAVLDTSFFFYDLPLEGDLFTTHSVCDELIDIRSKDGSRNSAPFVCRLRAPRKSISGG